MKIKTTILILLFFNAIGFAQHSIDISYNESIDLGTVEAKTQFLISGNNTNVKLKGDKINSYAFEKPGVYDIKVVHNEKAKKEVCEHSFPDDIVVNVSRIKMTFDASRIVFSTPILKNKETKGTVLTIPVRIETFDHKPIDLNKSTVNSAGIGVNITANLKEAYTNLAEGEHIIQYDLKGTVNQNSYLMFDFIDANGKVQPVALQTPITN